MCSVTPSRESVKWDCKCCHARETIDFVYGPHEPPLLSVQKLLFSQWCRQTCVIWLQKGGHHMTVLSSLPFHVGAMWETLLALYPPRRGKAERLGFWHSFIAIHLRKAQQVILMLCLARPLFWMLIACMFWSIESLFIFIPFEK